jgi:hypothetical protein
MPKCADVMSDTKAEGSILSYTSDTGIYQFFSKNTLRGIPGLCIRR